MYVSVCTAKYLLGAVFVACAVLMLDTPEGTTTPSCVLLPSLDAPDELLLLLLLPLFLFSCVPNTPPSTAPTTIKARRPRPIQSHLERFFLGW
jgi:hypothetical protein